MEHPNIGNSKKTYIKILHFTYYFYNLNAYYNTIINPKFCQLLLIKLVASKPFLTPDHRPQALKPAIKPNRIVSRNSGAGNKNDTARPRTTLTKAAYLDGNFNNFTTSVSPIIIGTITGKDSIPNINF